MDNTIIAALIGIFAGIFPVLLTRLFAVIEGRGSRIAKQKKVEDTKRLLDTFDAYLKVAEHVQTNEEITQTKAQIATKLSHFQHTLFVSPEITHEFTPYKERLWIQRFLLLYSPQQSIGWVWRLLYYTTLFGLFAIFYDLAITGEAFTGIDEDDGQFTMSYLFGELLGACLFLLIPLVFHRLAARIEK